MKDRSSSKINFKLEVSDHAIFSFKHPVVWMGDREYYAKCY